MVGQYCRVEKLDADRHAADLWAAYGAAPDGRDWTYLFMGPFADFAGYQSFARCAADSADPLHHAIIETATGRAVGTAALMRMDAANGVLEVGHVIWSPGMQRGRVGTEATYLLMRRAFDELGYRRYEWKCDSLNARSRAAAERYGFRFEGLFRQAIVYKGRSRDTAWYAITDGEWPSIRTAFEQWLCPGNFDDGGRQRRSLRAVRESITGLSPC